MHRNHKSDNTSKATKDGRLTDEQLTEMRIDMLNADLELREMEQDHKWAIELGLPGTSEIVAAREEINRAEHQINLFKRLLDQRTYDMHFFCIGSDQVCGVYKKHLFIAGKVLTLMKKFVNNHCHRIAVDGCSLKSRYPSGSLSRR